MADVNSRLLMHNEAQQAKVFYQGRTISPEFIREYFPQGAKETTAQWANRPKINSGISSAIVDRLVNIITTSLSITSENEALNESLQELLTEVNFEEFLREVMVNTLTTGNNLAVYRLGETVPQIENWSGEWLFWKSKEVKGYEFWVDEQGIIRPVYTARQNDNLQRVFINEFVFGDMEHNLGFDPSTFTKNLTKFDDGAYGKSYNQSWLQKEWEYDLLLSKIHKILKVINTVFTVNRDASDVNEPITLESDNIIYLGEDGVLDQVVSDKNLQDDFTALKELARLISQNANMPLAFAGINDVGSLPPSGVALTILMQPLIELAKRLNKLVNPVIQELVEKLVAMQMIINSGSAVSAELMQIQVVTSDAVLPDDEDAIIARATLLLEKGLINEEQAQLMISTFVPQVQ